MTQLDKTFESLCSDFEALSREPVPVPNAVDELATRIRNLILTSRVQQSNPQLALARRCAAMLNNLLAMRRGEIRRCSNGD